MESNKPTFHKEDDCGILEEGQKIPYFRIQLTVEQAELVKGKRIEIYETDGVQLFDLKRKSDGYRTGEKMFYAVFV